MWLWTRTTKFRAHHPLPKPGVWIRDGYYVGSDNILEALLYGYGQTCHEVEVDNIIGEPGSLIVAADIKILWSIDAETILRIAACELAENVCSDAKLSKLAYTEAIAETNKYISELTDGYDMKDELGNKWNYAKTDVVVEYEKTKTLIIKAAKEVIDGALWAASGNDAVAPIAYICSHWKDGKPILNTNIFNLINLKKPKAVLTMGESRNF